MQANQLLTQDTFNSLLAHMTTFEVAIRIRSGIDILAEAGLLIENYFYRVIRSGAGGAVLGKMIAILSCFCLNNIDCERNLSFYENKDYFSSFQFPQINYRGSFSDIKTLLSWEGPNVIGHLNSSLTQMFLHGVFLYSSDQRDEGETVMGLALSLKKKLRTFIEQPQAYQDQQKEHFIRDFITELHSKDELMVTKRSLWQVILTNVLIALSGIGLIAFGANYLVNKQCFFATRKTADFMDDLSNVAWIRPVLSTNSVDNGV